MCRFYVGIVYIYELYLVIGKPAEVHKLYAQSAMGFALRSVGYMSYLSEFTISKDCYSGGLFPRWAM